MKSTETNTDATTPDLIPLFIDLGVTLALSYVAVMDETQLRTLVMRVLRTGENFCQGQAVAWARAADLCKIGYDRVRLVS